MTSWSRFPSDDDRRSRVVTGAFYCFYRVTSSGVEEKGGEHLKGPHLIFYPNLWVGVRGF